MLYISTRFESDGQRLLYARVEGVQVGHGGLPRKVSEWRIFHQTEGLEPRSVGPSYRSKAELLADLNRYAAESGWK